MLVKKRTTYIFLLTKDILLVYGRVMKNPDHHRLVRQQTLGEPYKGDNPEAAKSTDVVGEKQVPKDTETQRSARRDGGKTSPVDPHRSRTPDKKKTDDEKDRHPFYSSDAFRQFQKRQDELGRQEKARRKKEVM